MRAFSCLFSVRPSSRHVLSRIEPVSPRGSGHGSTLAAMAASAALEFSSGRRAAYAVRARCVLGESSRVDFSMAVALRWPAMTKRIAMPHRFKVAGTCHRIGTGLGRSTPTRSSGNPAGMIVNSTPGGVMATPASSDRISTSLCSGDFFNFCARESGDVPADRRSSRSVNCPTGRNAVVHDSVDPSAIRLERLFRW